VESSSTATLPKSCTSFRITAKENPLTGAQLYSNECNRQLPGSLTVGCIVSSILRTSKG